MDRQTWVRPEQADADTDARNWAHPTVDQELTETSSLVKLAGVLTPGDDLPRRMMTCVGNLELALAQHRHPGCRSPLPNALRDTIRNT